MKDITIKTIGWTIFGCVFCIMFYGMFMMMSLSNANVTFNFNMDNETRQAIQDMKGLHKDRLDYELRLNNETMYGKNTSCLVGFKDSNDYNHILWYNSSLCYPIKK